MWNGSAPTEDFVTELKDNREMMVSFIREKFGDVLGEHARLLEQPDGLDQLADLLRSGVFSRRTKR